MILFYIKRRFDKHDAQEAARADFMFLLHKEASAGIALADEAAVGMQRCQHCSGINGELKKAQDYAAACKHEATDFVTKQGAKNLI